MIVCEDCNKKNKDYHNYCNNDGKDLEKFKSRLTLKEVEYNYCELCGLKINKICNYCPKCGVLVSRISINNKKNCGKKIINTDIMLKDFKRMWNDIKGLFV